MKSFDITYPEPGLALGHVRGPLGKVIYLEHAPDDLTRECADSLVHDVAWSRRGLAVHSGDSLHPVTLEWEDLAQQALKAGLDPYRDLEEEAK
jgi:hypothetical protein